MKIDSGAAMWLGQHLVIRLLLPPSLTIFGGIAIYLLDETVPGALTWIWLITACWIAIRAVFGVKRISFCSRTLKTFSMVTRSAIAFVAIVGSMVNPFISGDEW